MLPGDGRDSFEPVSVLKAARFFFVSHQFRQKGDVVVDDAVGNQAATFVPDMLLVFSFEAQLSEVGKGYGAA